MGSPFHFYDLLTLVVVDTSGAGAEVIVPIDGMISDEHRSIAYHIPASGRDENKADAFRASIITEPDQKRKNKAIHSSSSGWPDETKIDPNKENGSKNQSTKDKAGALPPLINHDEVLKSMKWTSYPASGCSQAEHNKLVTMFKGKIPASFSRYNCLRLLLELKHHQTTSLWTERAVLEELFFSLISFSEENILDTANWEGHPLVKHDTWLSDVHHCHWGGVTCGITTIGVAEGNQENSFDNTHETVEECKKSRLRARHRNRCDRRRVYDGWTCGECPPLDTVTKLDLNKLGFTGVLTANLYMLTHLNRINVMGNLIHGGFPDTFEQFKYLEFIDVSRNQMSGLLPEHLPMSIAELWYVCLNIRSYLSVKLIFKCNLLFQSYFRLEENHFIGAIPKSIATRKALSYVDLSQNSLTGTIPRDIGKMTWLNSLYLSRNQLSGKIPDW